MSVVVFVTDAAPAARRGPYAVLALSLDGAEVHWTLVTLQLVLAQSGNPPRPLSIAPARGLPTWDDDL